MLEKEEYMVCNVCKQTIRIRKNTPMGCYPIQHKRPNHYEDCHGFFEMGSTVKKL